MMLQAISIENFLAVGAMTLTLVLAVLGMTWSRNRQLAEAMDRIYGAIKKTADAANKRIDEVRDDYVHKDRLQDAITILTRSIDGLRDELRDNNRRMDRMLEIAFGKSGKAGGE